MVLVALHVISNALKTQNRVNIIFRYALRVVYVQVFIQLLYKARYVIQTYVNYIYFCNRCEF